ncbi:MAG TPA: glycoside hydrolase family 25 protein [Candidatus Saccharimonadales bacterium]|nr:glycoside hydrolase family 25 protein [Candidatus Saccharimonadales bacterium]
MPIYGIDVSSYQSNINMSQVKAEGFDFVIVKATEGDNYVNPSYASQVQNALNAGLLTMSYHFVHSADENGQVAEVERNVRKDLPLWLDSEVDGSGEYGVSVDLVARLRADGWNVVGTYFPQWFWSQIGSPDLRPLGLLWSSGYPSSSSGYASVLYPGDTAAGWNAYGNVTPSLYQFTDKALVAGLSVDASAFRGSRDQLSQLVSATPAVVQAFGSNDMPYVVVNPTGSWGALIEGTGKYTDLKEQIPATATTWNGVPIARGLSNANDIAVLQAQGNRWETIQNNQANTTAGGGSAPTAVAVAQAVQAQLDQERTDQLKALGFVPGTNPPPVV